MIEVSALLFTLLAEGVGLLSLILIIWIVLSVKKKGKDKAAAITLVKSIKTNADDRLEGIKAFLSQSAGLEGEELQLDVKKLDRLEKDFYTQIVHLYLKRDGEVLSSIDEQFDKVISAYKSYISKTVGEEPQVVDPDTLSKMETLKKENEKLALDLKITKETMGNMMGEFNTMFSGGNDTVQISKEALQTSMAEIEDESQDTNDGVDDAAVADSDETEADIDDIIFEGAGQPEAIETPAAEPAQSESIDIDDVLLSAANELEATAAASIDDSDIDFGEIVSSDDVDDLLDGIDLSKEIDVK